MKDNFTTQMVKHANYTAFIVLNCSHAQWEIQQLSNAMKEITNG